MKTTQIELYCVCILQVVVVDNYELTKLKVKTRVCVIGSSC
jgi:hypothetical protein